MLDWSSQTLSFKNSAEIIPTIHPHEMSSVSPCFRIALVDDAAPVMVHTHSNIYVPAHSEMFAEIPTAGPPRRSPLALIKPRIVHYMASSICPLADESIWESLVIARKRTNWQVSDASGIIRLCNASS